jgi:hypothetical protein
MKLLTYPAGIGGGQRLSHFREILGFKHTTDPTEKDITHAIYYDKKNRKDYPKEVFKPVTDCGIRVINRGLVSTKKDYVYDVFKDVFGYDIRVDPTKHRGMCLVRSSQNAIHQGKFVDCPIEDWQVDRKPRISGTGEPHYRQYVKIIDTRISKVLKREYRLMVIGRKPAMLFEKRMDIKAMFHVASGEYSEILPYKCYLHYLPKFTQEEADKIVAFIDAMDLDFGELDILRSNYDGRIYIVDVNDICAGQLFSYIPRELVIELAEQFKETFRCW